MGLHPFHFQQHRSICCYIGMLFLFPAHFSSHHWTDQLRQGRFFCNKSISAVSHNGNAIRDFKQFLQAMGNIDNGDSFGFQLLNNTEQIPDFVDGKCRCWFVHNQHFAVIRNAFCNFNHLLFGNGQGVYDGVGADIQLQLFQQFLCTAIILRPVKFPTFFRFPTNEYIIANRQMLDQV